VAYHFESWHFDVCIHTINLNKGDFDLIGVVVIVTILCPVSGLVSSSQLREHSERCSGRIVRL